MNGVYTNLAKKRAEQSNEVRDLGSVPPPPEKPVVPEAQEIDRSKETRKLGNKVARKQGNLETRKLGNAEQAVTETVGFDLNIEPYKKGTFIFTYEELDAVDDLKKQLKRRLDLPATQYDIIRAAIHIIVEDYHQRGQESFIVQRIRQKKAR
jgi:hypothetical protein